MLPGYDCASVKCARILFVLLAFSLLATFAAAQTTDSWTGTTGVWSDVTQWNNGVPVAGDNIVIGTNTADSGDDFSLAIGTLTVSNGSDGLYIADGVALTVSGTIANQGSISLSSAGTNTYLLISGTVSLSGSGTLNLGSGGPNYITGASGLGTEILASANTIQGVGNIGNGLMGFVNNGTVIANNSAANLIINVSSANFDNTGTLEAITGGNLTIQGPANSFVNYNGTTNTLTGGTYTANGGNIYFAGSGSGITTLSARVTQEAGGQLMNSTTGTPALANLSSITSTGVLTTTATFNQPGAFSMTGALNLLPKTSFSVGSLAQIVSGTLTGGQWVFDSNFNITGTPVSITTNNATLTLSGGTFYNTANSTDAMASLTTTKKNLRILNFAKLTTNGSLTNSADMTVAKGCKLTIGGTGTSFTQTGGKITNDGAITGAVNLGGGSFLGAGSIAGNFTNGGVKAGALLSVGDAAKAAQMKITGTYTQTANGKLSTAIGGTTVATQYSQLKVTGAATLAGPLAAPLLGTFVPTVGETFTVLTATSVTGTFSNSTIAINSSEHFAVSYTANSVVLTVTTGPAAE